MTERLEIDQLGDAGRCELDFAAGVMTFLAEPRADQLLDGDPGAKYAQAGCVYPSYALFLCCFPKDKTIISC